ncbi:SDR family NAD(P)-dependent oxidoreductase [Streptomyces hawaiiensis]|uniref:Oxidoreductase n=1 Tax=Streptomyces hawaiiensis TaxID=67305 RepID=A0A6G5R7G5_9ACTN|nr:SDR family NAD(P)-dependent oxidoreductase [Streptomyces hawaiiensis]QCD53597.1 oxidoreductase [Streptomyces hawaiiensis]
MPDTKQSTVAITGAGSGLGRDMALKLAASGYRVFGTALSADEITDLDKATDGAATLSLVDITDEDAVTAWVEQVSVELGQDGLDVLISNAGILTPGPLEVLPIAAVKREFDVNLFGGLSVINAFLPALRASRGRIVLIGAMTGRFPIPFNGPSSASKAALEAIADLYRAELKPFGIDVVMAQAGNMRTGGPAKSSVALRQVADSMTEEQRALYGEAFATFTDALNSSQASGLSSEASADRVIELVEQVPAPIRGAVGEDAEQILRLVREKSDAELDAMRLQLIGLGDA